MTNIAEYLVDLGKISHKNVEFCLQKNGQAINEISNISQAAKYATPINGVLKLYMYEKEDLRLDESIQNINHSNTISAPQSKSQPPMKVGSNAASGPTTVATVAQPKVQAKKE